MSRPKIYIDGKEGTTGLQIYERLGGRDDIELLLIDEDKRKDTEERRKFLNAADIVFLCLPDAAAVEAVSLIENDHTRVIDASTAHRTDPDWDYGFAELSKAHRAAIAGSKRVANPGCHASGFISSVYPLVARGVVPEDFAFTCSSLTGYSGGGKKMIAEYESEGRSPLLDAPRAYALPQHHKHLPEMKALTGLHTLPAFLPIVGDFYSGMLVTVPVFREDLLNGATIEDIRRVYQSRYRGPIVSYRENADESGFLSALSLSGLDRMDVSVFGNEDRILLAARYDNLGKGASGAAVECLNLVIGAAPESGLRLV